MAKSALLIFSPSSAYVVTDVSVTGVSVSVTF